LEDKEMLCDCCGRKIVESIWNEEERIIRDGDFVARFSPCEAVILSLLFERFGKPVKTFLFTDALWNDADEDAIKDPRRQLHVWKYKIARKLEGSRLQIRAMYGSYVLELKNDNSGSSVRRPGPYSRHGARPHHADRRGLISAGDRHRDDGCGGSAGTAILQQGTVG
jgi:hypothetical protein